MAYDSSDDYYHLTRNGWVDGGVQPVSDGPGKSVEIWHRSMTQASGWSQEVVRWFLEWKDESIPEDERTKLRRAFPKPTDDFRERGW